MRDSKQAGGINWVQVFAAAGAAVSSALLLSTLGVAGTMIGAAVGSLVASLATHTYSRGLVASRERALALRRINAAREDLDRLATHPEEDPEAGLEHADRALGRVEAGLEARRLSWRHVALVSAGLFVGVMVAITGFELLAGRAVSSYTGGSDRDTKITVPGVKDKPDKSPATPTPSSTPLPSGTPSTTPGATPGTPGSTPTATLAPTDAPTASEPPVTISPTEVPGG